MVRRTAHDRLGILVLAAGKGTRMESELAKVLHPVAGRPMLTYVLEAARQLQPQRTAVVVGHQGEQVKRAFAKAGVEWVQQTEMRGTGDAVRCAASSFQRFEGAILILYGDIPGIRSETLRRLVMVHRASKNALTLLTSELEDPTGYGRIVLAQDGSVARIVEEKDATEEEREIIEVNTGIGIYDAKFLFRAVRELKPNNRQKEFYLTDLVAAARAEGKAVGRLRLRDHMEVLGINDREDLAEVSRLFFDEKIETLLRAGVTFEDPISTMVDPQVEVGPDTTLGPGVGISGRSRLGSNVTVGSAARIVSSEISSAVQIAERVTMVQAKVGEGTRIAAGTVIGNREE